ncbi:MAG TPA: DnaB-like helicase C-terminal domain-containing protein, partial [Nitrosopumilaceae archaeon]|nr:DnaB-like helicase C-terminal domain-containing protein [Nitrosopumilaceae archaeon]
MLDPQLEETILSYSLNEKYTTDILRIADENSFPTHNKFWKYLKYHFNKYHKIPSLEVFEDLAGRNSEAIPFFALYKKLKDNLIHDKDFAYFTEKFKDYSTAQRLLQAVSDAVEDLKNNRGNAALQSLKHVILGQVSLLDDTTRDLDIVRDAKSRFEDYQKAKLEGNKDLVPSGFSPLDSACGGFHKGELITVIAPTNGGKSAFLLNLGYNAWKMGKNVMYVTLEMPVIDCTERFDSRHSGIPYGKFVVKSMTVEEETLYKEKLEELAKAPNSFRIVDIPRGCTTTFLESKIANSLDGIDILIVDYIGEMVVDSKSKADWEDQGKLALEMKQLARTY